MFLDSNRKLTAVLTTAKTTLNLSVTLDVVDLTTTTTTAVPLGTYTNGTTPVDIVPAPAASTIRKVNGLSIYGRDTASKIIRIYVVDATVTTGLITAGAFVVGNDYQIVSVGTTDFTLIGASANTVGVIFTATGVGTGTGTAATCYQIQDVTLQIDDVLGYTDTSGWYITDSLGNLKSVQAASATSIASAIHGATNKTTPVDADEWVIWDSITGLLNHVTWANIKATLLGVIAGKAVQADQAVIAWTRAATTTLDTSLNGTLSDTSATITAFNGVSGVTYHVRVLGAGSITHHATDLIITQGLASITTAAGDTFDVEMITATTCRIKNYVAAIKLSEIISSEIPAGSAVTLTTATSANITSITVSKGRWKITAEVSFIGDGSTSVTQYGSGISTTTATYPSKARFREMAPAFIPTSGVGFGGPTGDLYIEVAVDTPVYLVAQGTFTAGGFQAFGNIYATRY